MFPSVRRSTALRLARNPAFARFWVAQTISVAGDRLHQVALAVVVLGATSSPVLTALVFLAATLPNLVFGPVAGVFVDRWDRRRVMVASDLVRAALVLAIPVAVAIAPASTLVLAFMMTTVGLFFRPAKAAVTPQLVTADDLLAANSALWASDTLADLAGLGLSALIVALLGPVVAVAFVLDSLTYVASAALIAGLPVGGRPIRAAGSSIRSELSAGVRLLRGDRALFENTLLATLGQAPIAAFLTILVVYCEQSLRDGLVAYPGSYPVMMALAGIGGLVGAALVGPLCARMSSGRVILGGLFAYGVVAVLMGLTGATIVAFGLVAGAGLTNMLWLIPSQTMFMERVPGPMMGRVVAARQAVVFGAITGWMALASALVATVPAAVVITLFGLVSVAGAAVGFLRPALRDPGSAPMPEGAPG